MSRAIALALGLWLARGLVSTPVMTEPREPADAAAWRHWLGVEYHLDRRLDEASREYARALALDPPRALTADQHARVRRFAPRLFTVASEPFALEDVAVIVHPTRRLIAWHFFWDDDIDFPDDNDPTDHEVVWVGYSADGLTLERLWTYFHGRIVEGGPAAIADARRHGMRPRIDVQWGKHGSMPAGWSARPEDGEDGHTAAWKRLSTTGPRQKDHPVARRLGWPDRFAGAEADFTRFSRPLDPLRLLGARRMSMVTRWNSATISRHFLAYNFRPKTEWPPDDPVATDDRQPAALTALDRAGGAPDSPATPASLASWRLPAKSVFDRAMPRYPNLWLHLDATLASSYDEAIRLLTGGLDTLMGLQESYGPFSNPEGCDFEATREHLQPWLSRAARPLQHAHAFHIRYYASALAAAGLERVRLATASGTREYYRVPASAHYEVEHNNPHHADVESCPVCGRTGAYADRTGNLVEAVHDPLGLELALHGTIRGEPVPLRDSEAPARRAAAGFGSQFTVTRQELAPDRADQNTARIGVILVGPPGGQ